MPIYSWVITTNAATTQTTRKSIKGDYITYVNIRFPPGPQGLLKVKLYYGDTQLFPEEDDTYFAGDDEVIAWNEFLPIPERPMPLTIVTQNDDDTYAHSVYIRLATMYERQLLSAQIAGLLKKYLGWLFRGGSRGKGRA